MLSLVQKLEMPEETYMIQCPHCNHTFDAVASQACQCLSSVNTPACPTCGRCFCASSAEERRRFWSRAPQVLWHRRFEASSSRRELQVLPREEELPRPLVLVADDEPATRCVARRLLEKMGYGVALASNGIEALRLAKELHPDLVLTDALMPGLDGRELAKTIKEDRETAAIKVVLMTSLYTKESYRREALATFHCDGFLRKPVSAEDLRGLLTANLIPAPAQPKAV